MKRTLNWMGLGMVLVGGVVAGCGTPPDDGSVVGNLGQGKGQGQGQGQANQGDKVEICHHTHSEKNPIVLITVSPDALPAHWAHGDTYAINGTCGDISVDGGPGISVDSGPGISVDGGPGIP